MTFVRVNPGGYFDGVNGPTAQQLGHLQINLTRAVDGLGGGRYMPIAPIVISDSLGGGIGSSVIHGRLRIRSGGRIAFKSGSLPSTDNQTIGIASGGQILRFAPSAAVRQHQMDNVGAVANDWITLVSTAGSGNPVNIYIAGSAPGYPAGNLIVQLAAGAHTSATLGFDGTNWRLIEHSPGATPGPVA